MSSGRRKYFRWNKLYQKTVGENPSKNPDAEGDAHGKDRDDRDKDKKGEEPDQESV